jgi:hypothetical protein
MKNLRTNPFEAESYKDFWTLIANGSMQATFDQKMAQIHPEKDDGETCSELIKNGT